MGFFLFFVIGLHEHMLLLQVMHGGLFDDDSVTLDDIAKVNRNRQPPEAGISYQIRIMGKQAAKWLKVPGSDAIDDIYNTCLAQHTSS